MQGVEEAVAARVSRKGIATVVALLASLSFLAAGCETYTLEPDLFLATRSDKSFTVWSSDKSFPLNGRTLSGSYSLGFSLGKENQTVVYVPLAREDLPSGVDSELIDKVYLEIPLKVRSQEGGSAAFGVYRIVEDWRQHARLPSGIGPLEWPVDNDTLLMNLMSHWPPAIESDPLFTFNLICEAMPAKVTAINSIPIIPSQPEQLLRLDLTDPVKAWLHGEANYGILIKPLPDRYVPAETYWSLPKDQKPRLVFFSRSPSTQPNNPPASGSQ